MELTNSSISDLITELERLRIIVDLANSFISDLIGSIRNGKRGLRVMVFEGREHEYQSMSSVISGLYRSLRFVITFFEKNKKY